jgi:VCBS repeat-containing protein
VLANDTDGNNDTLTAAIVAGPSHGSVALNTDGSFTYTPASGYAGADSFTYTASDGSALADVATVNVTVVPRPQQGTTLAATAVVEVLPSLRLLFNFEARLTTSDGTPSSASPSCSRPGR